MRSGDDNAAISAQSALSAAVQCPQVPVEAREKPTDSETASQIHKLDRHWMDGEGLDPWVGLSEANQGSLAALQ